MRFYFPKTTSELWANSGILLSSVAGPHFKAILRSEISELTTGGGANTGEPNKHAVAPDEEFNDSDDETDERHPPPKVARTSPAPHAFQEIIITSAAHTTYAALLNYLYYAKLDFARLRSNRPRGPVTTSTASHQVSPKSLYRLSHYLSIPVLSVKCLQAIEAAIRPHNVAEELFGDVARDYGQVRKRLIDYTVAFWDEIKDTEALKSIQAASGEGGELGIALAVARQLSTKRVKREHEEGYECGEVPNPDW